MVIRMIIGTLILSLLGTQEDLDGILEKMRISTSTIKTMRSTYEQIKTMSLLEEEVTTGGTLFYDRAKDSTRWQSEDGTIQQVNRDRYIAVFPGLKEVEIYPLKERGKAFRTLMGSPDPDQMKKEFEITLVSSAGEPIQLKLRPKSDFLKKRIREAHLQISSETHLITEVRYTETNGDTVRILFRNRVINPDLPAGTFKLDLDALRTKGYNIREHE
jgi:outer membrane lipoprotein-sorting protein